MFKTSSLTKIHGFSHLTDHQHKGVGHGVATIPEVLNYKLVFGLMFVTSNNNMYYKDAGYCQQEIHRPTSRLSIVKVTVDATRYKGQHS